MDMNEIQHKAHIYSVKYVLHELPILSMFNTLCLHKYNNLNASEIMAIIMYFCDFVGDKSDWFERLLIKACFRDSSSDPDTAEVFRI
jgi:hypothetical protein